MKRNKQQGFTLIELVVVIIILGILAAVALPRFVNLQEQARYAKLQGAVAAVRAASSLYHATCLTQAGTTSGVACPADTSTSISINMEGTSVTGVAQYPTANSDGILAAAGVAGGAAVGTGVDYVVSGGGTAAGDTLTITVPGATDSTKCQFTYKAATITSNVVVAPVVTLPSTTSPCI